MASEWAVRSEGISFERPGGWGSVGVGILLCITGWLGHYGKRGWKLRDFKGVQALGRPVERFWPVVQTV